MIVRFLSWLLWLANGRAQRSGARYEVYQIKDRLLRQSGHLVGHDIQHIVKQCYECDGCGEAYYGGEIFGCARCQGSGIWDQFWVRLERWEFGGRTFHRPLERMFKFTPAEGRPIIHGRIEHATPERDGDEAILWLLFLFDRAAWWRQMRMPCYRREWTRPMLAIHILVSRVAWLARKFDQRSCLDCHRVFRRPFRWRGSWHLCSACANAKAGRRWAVQLDDDLPF